ncbi:uncharacterized protein LOC110414217 [Herrania umbratica]|uniref:Uncharacterized protein LOC110414217 n=1 Tax=Herrania umbratica TaxID=108875 RepID=A0A6J1A1F0_9ROSI|nr:uncharacterized protein LOC110414217 [Herrania umbratica]
MTSFQQSLNPNLKTKRLNANPPETAERNRESATQKKYQKRPTAWKFSEIVVMEGQPQVKASLRLGSEFYTVNAKKDGALSEQLSSMKEESMSILREFITKHNVPNDVPDESVESSSDDEEEVPKKPNVKSKKAKIN